MHISTTQPTVTHHHPEPQRPVHHEAQESSRPVVAPNQSEAAAQETRQNDERRVDQEHGKHDDAHTKRAEAKSEPDSKHHVEKHRPRNADPAVGSQVDVFA